MNLRLPSYGPFQSLQVSHIQGGFYEGLPMVFVFCLCFIYSCSSRTRDIPSVRPILPLTNKCLLDTHHQLTMAVDLYCTSLGLSKEEDSSLWKQERGGTDKNHWHKQNLKFNLCILFSVWKGSWFWLHLWCGSSWLHFYVCYSKSYEYNRSFYWLCH